jgi:hypothetical protein
VKRREQDAPGFLERPAVFWQRRLPHAGKPEVVNQLRALAGSLLAGMGELRADELARVRAIAAGLEHHPTLDREQARRILERPFGDEQ